MPLEASTYIDGLDASWPLGGDPTNKGDDHLRLIKTIFKNTFPGVGGLGFATAITATEVELNYTSGLTSNAQAQFDGIGALLAAVKESLFPVGSVYTNAVNATNPSTLLGFGTWVAFGAGRVSVGHNASNSLFNAGEKTGGQANSITPAHSHTASTNTASLVGSTEFKNRGGGVNSTITETTSGIMSTSAGNGSGEGWQGEAGAASTNVNINASHGHTVTVNSAGTSATDANYQPFITVYMWKRTA
tara:strand:- start:18900 stop:19637 length:738 start_codon:yes stop_codon:yes gene_type:complete